MSYQKGVIENKCSFRCSTKASPIFFFYAKIKLEVEISVVTGCSEKKFLFLIVFVFKRGLQREKERVLR